jgi:hypothetical protein
VQRLRGLPGNRYLARGLNQDRAMSEGCYIPHFTSLSLAMKQQMVQLCYPSIYIDYESMLIWKHIIINICTHYFQLEIDLCLCRELLHLHSWKM